jgi:hypothetical protein
MMRKLNIFLLIFIFIANVFALEPIKYQSIRSLGMGGAFLGIANDKSAMLINPAGLHQIERVHLEVLNGNFSYNNELYDILDEKDAIMDIADNSGDDIDMTKVSDLISKIAGKRIDGKMSNMVYFMAPNFGVGFLMQTQAMSVFSKPTNFNYHIQANGVLFGSISKTINQLSTERFATVLGVTGKAIFLTAYNPSYGDDGTDSLDLAAVVLDNTDLGLEDRKQDGMGFGLDIAAMVRYRNIFDPRVTMVIRDFMDTKIGDVGSIPQQVDIGFAANVFPDFSMNDENVENRSKGKFLGVFDQGGTKFAVDIKDMFNDDKNLFMKLHAGVESKIQSARVRLGIYQGYLTFGFGLKAGPIAFRFAQYSEEGSTRVGIKEIKNTALQFSWVF